MCVGSRSVCGTLLRILGRSTLSFETEEYTHPTYTNTIYDTRSTYLYKIQPYTLIYTITYLYEIQLYLYTHPTYTYMI
jgi:hypothetical protein